MLVNGFLFTSSSGTASCCLMTVWKSKVSNEVFAESSQSVLTQSLQGTEHMGISTAEKCKPNKSEIFQAGQASGPRHSEKPRAIHVFSKWHPLNPPREAVMVSEGR